MKSIPFEGACEKTRRYLDSYVDNELLVETSHEVLRHLESCPACTAEAESRAALKQRVRGAVRAQAAPPELAAAVRQRLRTAEPRPWWSLGSFSVPQWVGAGAAAAVLCGGLWFAVPRESYPAIGDRPAQNAYISKISTRLAAVLRPGLADHVHCAVFRKYPATPPPVATMLADLGSYRELLPAINAAIPSTWKVLMAHQCTYQGRKYVHVTMKDGDRLVSLVITKRGADETFDGLRPSINGHDPSMYQSSAGSYQVAAYATDNYLAYLVSDLPAEQNLAALSRLKKPVSAVLLQIL